MFSAFNPSKCTHLEQWAADCAAPGEQSWTSCRSRDSNPQPWVTSGFKSNSLSIRPTTARQKRMSCTRVLSLVKISHSQIDLPLSNVFLSLYKRELKLQLFSIFIDIHFPENISAVVWFRSGEKPRTSSQK